MASSISFKTDAWRRLRVAGLLFLFPTLFLGCGGIGPSGISSGRPAYNAAIQRTSNEEMLLNIVRLRYRDTPFFLQVSGVAANISTQMGISGGAEIPSRGPTVGTIGASALVNDNPTVTYSPLQGDDFVTQLLTPVRLETLLLLIDTGWSIERVLRLCAQRLGDARNAPSASGPTPERAPSFEEFRRVSQLLGILQRRDGISLSIRLEEPPGLTMRFRDSEMDSPEAVEIAQILNLEPQSEQFIFSNQIERSPNRQLIAIETRSLMGSLFYLSQAVSPPRRHEEKEWVTITRNSDGTIFSWDQVMDGLFDVRTHATATSEAFLTTTYLGRTFSIAQDDLDSKATFALLNQLFALQAGASDGGGPLLTLPVSR